MLFLLTSYFLESYLAAEMKVLKQGMNFIMKQVFYLISFQNIYFLLEKWIILQGS